MKEEKEVTTLDKIFRIAKPVFFLLVTGFCFGFVHLVALAMHGSDFYYNHFNATICGFPVLLFILIFSCDFENRREKKSGFWVKTFSFLGAAFLVLGGLAFTVIVTDILQLPTITPLEGEIDLSVAVLLVSTVVATLCSIFIWSKYTPKKGTAQVLNGRIFYEGQSFSVWPFLYYWQDQVLEETFLVTFRIKITGVAREVTFFFNPRFDFQAAQTSSITRIDLHEIKSRVEYSLSGLCLEGGEIAEMGYFGLLAGQTASPMNFDLNFPVVWDGQFTICTH